MANDLVIDGRLGYDPRELERKDGKRACVFDIAHQPNKRYPAYWFTIKCVGKVAEIVLDGINLGVGDFVRITGFLGSKSYPHRCGESHRGQWIWASRVYQIAPKAGVRDDRLFDDAARTQNFTESL